MALLTNGIRLYKENDIVAGNYYLNKDVKYEFGFIDPNISEEAFKEKLSKMGEKYVINEINNLKRSFFVEKTVFTPKPNEKGNTTELEYLFNNIIEEIQEDYDNYFVKVDKLLRDDPVD